MPRKCGWIPKTKLFCASIGIVDGHVLKMLKKPTQIVMPSPTMIHECCLTTLMWLCKQPTHEFLFFRNLKIWHEWFAFSCLYDTITLVVVNLLFAVVDRHIGMFTTITRNPPKGEQSPLPCTTDINAVLMNLYIFI